jgi:hypothetical protein
MKRAHGIRISIVGLELDRGPPNAFPNEREIQKLAMGAGNSSRIASAQHIFTSAELFIFLILLDSPWLCDKHRATTSDRAYAFGVQESPRVAAADY